MEILSVIRSSPGQAAALVCVGLLLSSCSGKAGSNRDGAIAHNPQAALRSSVDAAIKRATGKPPANWCQQHNEKWRRHMLLIDELTVDLNFRAEVDGEQTATLIVAAEHIQSDEFDTKEEAENAVSFELATLPGFAEKEIVFVQYARRDGIWQIETARLEMIPPDGQLSLSSEMTPELRAYFEPTGTRDRSGR